MKRFLALLLAAAMILSAATMIFADESTTTIKTVYKDNSANTEIYAVTQTAGSDYPYYGAKYEPKGGVYYGRVGVGGEVPNPPWGMGYGLANKDEMADTSIVSYYTNLRDDYSVEYWSYLWGKATEDGNHALLINMNFDGENEDIQPVIDGEFDTKLIADFEYLEKQTFPVFFRIGGEMNAWANKVTPANFIKAYQHIAELARKYAPSVALVFSPNFSADTNVDMDSFYPGDEYVDWVGVSLYYNQYPNAGNGTNFANWEAFYGVGTYGDALLNVQQVVNLSRMHKKPLMITEGGSRYTQDGKEDMTSFAAARVEKAMADLTIVYPEIKAIVYSDTDFGREWEGKYNLRDNATVSAAYDAGVAANETYLHGYKSTDYSYYTKLSAYDKLWSGDVKLAAYTYYSGLEKLTAAWTVDGKTVGTATTYPYNVTVKTAELANGAHTVKVAFSNGAEKEYKFYVGSVEPESKAGLDNFKKVNTYKSGIFSDVNESGWYFSNVKTAYELGLMKGSGSGFNPDGNITIIETLALAAKIHKNYYTGNGEFTQGSPWYQVYIDYAAENGIISEGEYLSADSLMEVATREQFAYILSKAIPASELPAISTIEDGAIPDVELGTRYTDAIYMLYRAGILTGNDTKGTFTPKANIGRSSVAALATRLVDKSLRKAITLKK